jgi:hypothetical protein
MWVKIDKMESQEYAVGLDIGTADQSRDDRS